MLNVQKYLQNHSLEDLENEFSIIVTRYEDRIVLNYSQLSSPKFHYICDECRGLILSWPDLKVLCRPFNRFYNLYEGGEFSENEFSPNRMICFTKVDGSLINLHHDGNEWQCATRKRAFAEGETAKGNSFRDVVDRAFSNWKEKMKDLSSNFTYICEVVSPETRIVVPYPDYDIYLLAMRDNYYGDFLDHKAVEDIADVLGIKTPKKYKFNDLDNVLSHAKELEPMNEDGEGYVCYDPKTDNRIKIKNPSYLALCHLRENGAISNKRIAKLVMEQDYEEYLSYFPEDREFFQPYIDAYEKMMKDINETWDKNKDIESQKEFALNVKDKPIGSIMFSLRKGSTLNDISNNLTDKKKFELLEKYKIKEK